MTKQHLLIVIDKERKIAPQKYKADFFTKEKDSFIKGAKQLHEQKFNTKNYETFYFEHVV